MLNWLKRIKNKIKMIWHVILIYRMLFKLKMEQAREERK